MKAREVEIVYRVYLLKRSTGKDGETSSAAIACFREILIMSLNAYTSQIQDISYYTTTNNTMHNDFYRTQFLL